MGTSVELVEGWRVKRILQIGEIWPGQFAAGTRTEKDNVMREVTTLT